MIQLAETARPGRQNLDVLQAGRGIASLLVVFFHANVIFSAGKYWGAEVWPGFRMGHAGVEFFFVLSGFIIAYIHLHEVGQPKLLPRFVMKRLVRIYPVYWAALVLMVLPLFVSPSFDPGASRAPLDILHSALLLPGREAPHLEVAWTLRHEMLFYALFGTLLIHPWAGVIVLALWFGGSAVWTIFGSASFPGNFYLSTHNLLFPMGMACAWLVRKGRVPMPGLLAISGIFIFAATGALDVMFGGNRVLTLTYGLGSAASIVGLVELERSRRLSVHRSLAMLGDASYSIYLIHYLALSLGAKVIFSTGLAVLLPPQLAFIMMVAGATAAGLMFRWLIEKWLVDYFGKMLVTKRY